MSDKDTDDPTRLEEEIDGEIESDLALDFDSLDKGVYLSPDICEGLVKCHDRFDSKYSFQLLQLKKRIQEELRKRQKPVVVRGHQGGLQILADEVAAGYTENRFKAALRLASRSHQQKLEVDRGQLQPLTLKRHERALEIQSRTLLAAKAASKEPSPLKAHKRVNPGVPRP